MNNAGNKRIKYVILIISVALVLAIGGGVALAYIMATPPELPNVFEPGVVSCTVNETFDSENKTKSDVFVTNTGNVDAYVRADIIITWRSKTDTSEIMGRAPVRDTDYTITYGSDLWFLGGDGFWYYKDAVPPNEATDELIATLKQISEAPEGYALSVEILASAIQASPADVASNEWGVIIENGRITATKPIS